MKYILNNFPAAKNLVGLQFHGRSASSTELRDAGRIEICRDQEEPQLESGDVLYIVATIEPSPGVTVQGDVLFYPDIKQWFKDQSIFRVVDFIRLDIL